MRLGDAFGVPTLPLSITKTFTPPSIAYGATSTLSIKLQNQSGTALTSTSFLDTFPGGMATTTTPGVTNDCGGTVIAAPNSLSLSLSGGTVPASGFCTITAQVTGLGSGNVVNAIPIHGAQSSNSGWNSAPGSGALVLPDRVGDSSDPMVQDGSFELGGTPVPWTQFSTHFGSPLVGPGTNLLGEPRTGIYYLWFGNSN